MKQPAILPEPLGFEKILVEEDFFVEYEPHLAWPQISIVVPSFQQGRFLETTLRSLFLQNYPNLQVLLIDGGSTDETMQVIQHYRGLISYWVSEPDKGQSDALNKGIARCTGQIFNWLNSDDWLEPGALYLIGTQFRDTEALALTSRANIVKLNQIEYVNSACSIFPSVWETASVRGLNQQGLFYRMECIRLLNGVDPLYHYSMDLDLWIRFLLSFGQERVRSSEAITANFRFHADSKSELEGWGPGSASDIETKAMRLRFARAYAPTFLPAMKLAYPDYAEHLLSANPHSPLRADVVKTWLSELLINQAQAAFYENQSGIVQHRLTGWWPYYLSKPRQRDFFTYRSMEKSKWIHVFFVLMGRIFNLLPTRTVRPLEFGKRIQL
jgi:glycosyltransferase involved in cell wall biosynthesis